MHRPLHRTARPARPARLAAFVVAAGALVACGGDDGGSGGDDPEGFAYRAARTCTEIANEIDYTAADPGNDASLDAVLAAAKGEPPAEATATELANRMAGYVEVLRDIQDQLRDLEPDDDADAAAWAVLVDSGTPRIELFESRVALIRAGDWNADFQLGGGDADLAALEDALVELELFGRDCEILYTYTGNPPEWDEFLDAASTACTTIASRRMANGFTTDLTLGAVLNVHEDDEVTITDELIAESEALAEEWEATRADFAEVPTEGTPDDDEWTLMLEAVAERVDVFEDRTAALEDGDQTELRRLYTPGAAYEHPGSADLTRLALDRRDCRSIPF